jgi:hypothetical protein
LYGIDGDPIEAPKTIARIKHAGYEPSLRFVIASENMGDIMNRGPVYHPLNESNLQ